MDRPEGMALEGELVLGGTLPGPHTLVTGAGTITSTLTLEDPGAERMVCPACGFDGPKREGAWDFIVSSTVRIPFCRRCLAMTMLRQTPTLEPWANDASIEPGKAVQLLEALPYHSALMARYPLPNNVVGYVRSVDKAEPGPGAAEWNRTTTVCVSYSPSVTGLYPIGALRLVKNRPTSPRIPVGSYDPSGKLPAAPGEGVRHLGTGRLARVEHYAMGGDGRVIAEIQWVGGHERGLVGVPIDWLTRDGAADGILG
jgi:hypothetical protein